MKKNMLKVLSMSLLLSALCVSGCSCGKDKPNVAEIKDGDILNGLTEDVTDYSLLDVYNAVIASDVGNKAAANKLVDIVASTVLKLDKDEDVKERYDDLVEEKLDELKENEEYFVNGKFNEELLVLSLKAEGYDVSAGDYEDYVNKVIRVDVLSTLLKEKYIAEVTLKDSKNTVTNKKIRDVEYISISTSIESNYSDYKNDSDEDVEISARDFMRDIRNKIVKAVEDEDLSSINFEAYVDEVKEILEGAINAECDKITNADDYSQELAAKYTNNYTRSVEEGLKERLEELDDLELNVSKLLSSDTGSSDVISETITSRLLNLSKPADEPKRAIKIGDWYYLVSLNAGTTVDANDILLTETTDSSTYTYSIVRFKVINADNYKSNKDEVVELLAKSSTLANGAVAHYLGEYKNNITINDDSVYEYLKTLYPDVFTD